MIHEEIRAKLVQMRSKAQPDRWNTGRVDLVAQGWVEALEWVERQLEAKQPDGSIPLRGRVGKPAP